MPPSLHPFRRIATGLSYRGRIMASATAAAAFPLAFFAVGELLGANGPGPLILLATAGAASALAVLSHQLRPLAEVARGLRSAAGAGGGSGAPADILQDLQTVRDRLHGLRHRLINRHPVTDLPTREPFLAAVQLTPDAPGALGVVRFADYGRLAGFDQAGAERALKIFAARLTGAADRTRPLAQVDRDCFALWFADAADPARAAAELEALSYVLSQEIAEGDLKLSPEVALAAAVYPYDGDDAASLLTRAIAALPQPGQSGAAAVAFFSSRHSEEARERYLLEQDLRRAVARDELVLHYQPLVDISAGRVAGAEALVRWNHSERGLVSPTEFIPVLEACGMMEEIGQWVLNSACREARRWRDEGLEHLTVAVNLSAEQLRDPNFDKVVLRTLERHGLPSGALELELTETATMADAARTRRLFGELREMGVGVAIDDFGAGYSSLSYLKNLPFTKLKIDREFVTEVHERNDSHAICKALVELSRGLGISVLAEGVETAEEVRALERIGCAAFQGFYFSRPLPGDAFRAAAADSEWLVQRLFPLRRQRASLRRASRRA